MKFTASIIAMLIALTTALAQAEPNVPISATLNSSALPAGQTAVLAVVLDLPPNLHVQSHTPLDQYSIPLNVAVDPAPGLTLLSPVYPSAQIVNFPELGQQSIIQGRVIVYVPIRIAATAPIGPVTLTGKITWQACDQHECFQAHMGTKATPFNLPAQIVSAAAPVTLINQSDFTHFDQSVFSTNAPPAAAAADSVPIEFFGHTFRLALNNWSVALSIALVVGLLFNLVPCVLPVLPLKAIGFLEVSRQNRARCLLLGAVFSAGIVFVFALLAVLIVLFSFAWGEQFKHPWFIWSISAILAVMALGMFGLFEVALPTKIYDLSPNHETVSGNFLFGILAAVLSTPCTAPMFPGLLAYSLGVPHVLGITIVITVGIGMVLPYLLLSAFPQLARWVPASGPWSLVLKQMLGFLLLAAAVYFAGGQITTIHKFIWAIFAVIAAAMIFLVIRTVQLTPRPRPIAITAIAAVLVIVAAWLVTQRFTNTLEWNPYTPKALADARATGDPVLVEFTANWCGNCQALEATVFHDQRTKQAIDAHHVILLRADLTADQAPGWDIVNRLNPGGGIPLTAIYTPGDPAPTTLTSLYTTQNLIDALSRTN